ncbi:MAG: TonB-dependent receptor [Lentisphaeraceae bacterium]|nr:TonB-dependent receptor [Lentisphaeraceae bacterium]
MNGAFQYSANIGFTGTERIDEPFAQNSSQPRRSGFAHSSDFLEDERLYFDFFGQFKKLSFDINHAEVDRGTIYLLPPDQPQETHNKRSHYRLKYSETILEDWTLDLSATYTETDFDLQYHPALVPGTFAVSTLSATGLTLEALASYQAPSDDLDFKLGYIYESFDEPANGFYIPDFGIKRHILSINDQASHAVWSQVRKHFDEHWTVVAGLRLEQAQARTVSLKRFDASGAVEHHVTDKYDPDTQVLPQLALIYNINEKQQLKLMYATGYRDPSNISFFNEIFETESVSLEQAEIDSIELSYLAMLDNDWQITANVYYSKLDKIISRASDRDPNTGDITLITDNSGKMTSQGMELGIKGNLSDTWQVEANFAYTDVKNDNQELTGIKAGFSPRQLASLNLFYQITADATLGLSAIYVGKMKTSWDIATASREADDVGAYTLLDLNFRKENFLTENAFIQLGVHNLLDKDYRYGANKNNANSGYNKGFPGAGRSFLVTVGMKF